MNIGALRPSLKAEISVNFLRSIALCASSLTVLLAVAACAQDDHAQATWLDEIQKPSGEQIVGESLSGNYLAGRFAQRRQDWSSAEHYMNTVLARDKDNRMLLQRTFLLALGTGDTEKARELATKVAADNVNPELALLFLSIDAFTRDQYSEALSQLEKIPVNGFGQFTKPVLSAWALQGMGKTEEAVRTLKAPNEKNEDPAYSLHIAMIYEHAGDDKKALEFYKRSISTNMTLHGASVTAHFLEAHGETELARVIFDGMSKAVPFGPPDMIRKEQGELTEIKRPADGAALALLDIATLLFQKNSYDSALIYTRLTDMLKPRTAFIALMMGDIVSFHNRLEEASRFYQQVPAESALFHVAQMRQASLLEDAGRADDAIALLNRMSENEALRTQAYTQIGDIYRRSEKYDKAVDAYNAAINSVDSITEKHWPLIYARGMSFERTNNWTLAEKDLIRALELQPDNPLILNYLGYSWVDQGKNLEKALEMVKKAVMLRPDDGYVIDSYGWALYRTEKYADAVAWLEKAIAQVPNDPTINDHLGDAYWKVGRKHEARFQWRRAADLTKDAALKANISRKMNDGLPETSPQRDARVVLPE